jgi:hypothetical protein
MTIAQDREVLLRFLQPWSAEIGETVLWQRHIMRARVPFPSPFANPPSVWVRNAASWGAGPDTVINRDRQLYGTICPGGGTADCQPAPPPWTPAGEVESVSPDSVTLTTFIYSVTYDGQMYWWPTHPDSARVAYTAVGLPSGAASVGRSAGGVDFAFSVSPNPARSIALFDIRQSTPAHATLSIYDIAGRCTRRFTILGSSGLARSIAWDLRDEAGARVHSGVYYARLQTVCGTRCKRFVVCL